MGGESRCARQGGVANTARNGRSLRCEKLRDVEWIASGRFEDLARGVPGLCGKCRYRCRGQRPQLDALATVPWQIRPERGQTCLRRRFVVAKSRDDENGGRPDAPAEIP